MLHAERHGLYISSLLPMSMHDGSYKVEGVLPIWIKQAFKSLQKTNTVVVRSVEGMDHLMQAWLNHNNCQCSMSITNMQWLAITTHIIATLEESLELCLYRGMHLSTYKHTNIHTNIPTYIHTYQQLTFMPLQAWHCKLNLSSTVVSQNKVP